MNELERKIRQLTKPINGQYPRPWMTTDSDPSTVGVFIVGRNQKNGYPTAEVGTHDTYIDSLFNRNGASCRGLYDRITQSPSPTRQNSDAFVRMLAKYGINRTIETNVICYSSPMSSDLRRAEHSGGSARGKEIFSTLLELISPRIIVAHGEGTLKDLSNVLDTQVEEAPSEGSRLTYSMINGVRVYPIPSLAPPACNRWTGWREAYLSKLAADAAEFLRQPTPS